MGVGQPEHMADFVDERLKSIGPFAHSVVIGRVVDPYVAADAGRMWQVCIGRRVRRIAEGKAEIAGHRIAVGHFDKVDVGEIFPVVQRILDGGLLLLGELAKSLFGRRIGIVLIVLRIGPAEAIGNGQAGRAVDDGRAVGEGAVLVGRAVSVDPSCTVSERTEIGARRWRGVGLDVKTIIRTPQIGIRCRIVATTITSTAPAAVSAAFAAALAAAGIGLLGKLQGR